MKAILITSLMFAFAICGCEKDKDKPSPTPTPGTGTTAEAGPLEGFWILKKTIDNTGVTTPFTPNTAAIVRFKGSQTFTIFMDNGDVECGGKYRPFSFAIPNLTLEGLPECVQKTFDSVRIFGTVAAPELNVRRVNPGAASDGLVMQFDKLKEADFNTLIRNRGYTAPQ